MLLSKEDVRAAGGIVHSDGNVFFTNLEQLNAAILAKLARAELPEPTVYSYNIETHANLLDAYSADQLTAWGNTRYAQGAAAQLSSEPVFFAYQYDDGTWHDGSSTEHSVGMKHLYTRREA